MDTYFAEEAPRLERRGANIFVIPGYADHRVAIGIPAMRAFHRKLGRLLAEFDAEQTVVPMRGRG